MCAERRYGHFQLIKEQAWEIQNISKQRPHRTTWARRKSGDDKRLDYLKIVLEDVVVSSWQTSASDGSGIPMLSISFAFSKIQYVYKVQNADQTLGDDLIATYDLKAAKK